MRAERFAVLLAAAMLASSCSEQETTAPVHITGFAVTGIVKDELGRPLEGAVAGIASYGAAWSNAAGVFTITGVTGGSYELQVWKEGYTDYSRELTITSDLLVEVKLTQDAYADSIVLGQTVRSNVATNAPPCDPIQWDAKAPCRRFTFTPPQTGVLVISVTWQGGSPLDVLIMNPGGGYMAFSNETNTDRATVSASVVRGAVYEVRVNSYYSGQVFDLRADLYASSAGARIP